VPVDDNREAEDEINTTSAIFQLLIKTKPSSLSFNSYRSLHLNDVYIKLRQMLPYKKSEFSTVKMM
jgi:hypothetical protein